MIHFLRTRSLVGAFLGIFALSVSSGLQASQTLEKPNILVILVDDLGYHDMSCQGATDFKTPQLDRLAASGVRFTDGYITAPQCGPSRAGIITGMSQSRFGCLDNRTEVGLPSADIVQTIPEQLKALGYTTGMIGKWHIGFLHDGGDVPYDTLPGNNPWERGFDTVLMHHGGGTHYYPYRKDGIKWMTSRNREPRLLKKADASSKPQYLDDLPKHTYLTDYFSAQAADFVRQNKEQPWFLYLSYNAPHTPLVAKKEALKKYRHNQDKNRRQFIAVMDSLDEGVGHVLDALEETGQTKRTLVWFLSDNGGPTKRNASRNDPLSGAKGDMHEGGIRVPFLAAWPGMIPPNQVLNGPVTSLDILPTSLAAAGKSKVAPIHDGKNLLPWLEGKAPCPNEALFWSWRGHGAIRIGTLKETRSGKPVIAMDGSEVPARIFVDLATNPQELASKELGDEASRRKLSERLDAWLQQVKQDQATLTPEVPTP